MTLPNGVDGVTPSLLFPLTYPVEAGYNFPLTHPAANGTIPGMGERTQPIITEILKAYVQQSTSWLNSTDDVWAGLRRGVIGAPVSLMLALIEPIINKLGNTALQFPTIEAALNALADVPFVGDLIEILTGIEDGDLEDLGTWVNTLLNSSSPLNALNIFGVLPTNVFGSVPIGALTDIIPNLLPLSHFPMGSIAEGPGWIVDELVTATGGPGSAKIIADGLPHGLRGIEIPVVPNQVFDLSVLTQWTGLVSSGSPIQLGVVAFNKGQEVARTIIGSIANPGASSPGWVPVSGQYTVPADGSVDAIKVRLMLSPLATAGTVWFDDVSGTQPGEILQEWVENLPEQFQGILDIFGLGALTDLIGPDITTLWTNTIQTIINPLELLTELPDFTSLLNIFGGTAPILPSAIAEVNNAWTNLLKMFDIDAPDILTPPPSLFNPAPVLTDMINNQINPLGMLGQLSGSGQLLVLQSPPNLIAGFQNIFNQWFAGTGAPPAAGTPAEVAETIENMRTVVLDGYTLVFFTSNSSWVVPTGTIELWCGCIGGGGRGEVGSTGGGWATGAMMPGGRGGSSGGYTIEKVDPTPFIGTALTISIGTAATSPGTDGGYTQISRSGLLVRSQVGIGGILSPQGWVASSSTPGRGGEGGAAQVLSRAYNGTDGFDAMEATGGSRGNGTTAASSATGAPGSSGSPGQTNALPISGGSGGGGGGGATTTNSVGGTAQGGIGGNGGYPGGGSGGGGAATSATATGGNPGSAANGMAFVMYKRQ